MPSNVAATAPVMNVPVATCQPGHGTTRTQLTNRGGRMTYMILRFYQERGRSADVIETGLTFEEAEEHCNDPDTSGPGWFDGYTKEE